MEDSRKKMLWPLRYISLIELFTSRLYLKQFLKAQGFDASRLRTDRISGWIQIRPDMRLQYPVPAPAPVAKHFAGCYRIFLFKNVFLKSWKIESFGVLRQGIIWYNNCIVPFLHWNKRHGHWTQSLAMFRYSDYKYEVVLFEKIKLFGCNGRDVEMMINHSTLDCHATFSTCFLCGPE